MAARSSTAGVNSLMTNFYGQTQNSDGSWNGVTIDNQPPIDVEGYIPPAKSAGPERTPVKVRMFGTSQPPVEGAKPKEQAQQTDSGKVGQGQKAATSVAKTTAGVLTEQDEAYRTGQQILAAGEFIVDVLNAQSAYRNAAGQAGINIQMARNSANDAIYRGRQAAFDRQSEGFQAGEDVALAMAAQGQDVSAGATEKLRGSYQAMGYVNAAREEINAMREAMGYQLEEIQYNYDSEMAEINRDIAIWGSGLSTAAKIGAYSV